MWSTRTSLLPEQPSVTLRNRVAGSDPAGRGHCRFLTVFAMVCPQVISYGNPQGSTCCRAGGIDGGGGEMQEQHGTGVGIATSLSIGSMCAF